MADELEVRGGVRKTTRMTPRSSTTDVHCFLPPDPPKSNITIKNITADELPMKAVAPHTDQVTFFRKHLSPQAPALFPVHVWCIGRGIDWAPH